MNTWVNLNEWMFCWTSVHEMQTELGHDRTVQSLLGLMSHSFWKLKTWDCWSVCPWEQLEKNTNFIHFFVKAALTIHSIMWGKIQISSRQNNTIVSYILWVLRGIELMSTVLTQNMDGDVHSLNRPAVHLLGMSRPERPPLSVQGDGVNKSFSLNTVLLSDTITVNDRMRRGCLSLTTAGVSVDRI